MQHMFIRSCTVSSPSGKKVCLGRTRDGELIIQFIKPREPDDEKRKPGIVIIEKAQCTTEFGAGPETANLFHAAYMRLIQIGDGQHESLSHSDPRLRPEAIRSQSLVLAP